MEQSRRREDEAQDVASLGPAPSLPSFPAQMRDADESGRRSSDPAGRQAKRPSQLDLSKAREAHSKLGQGVPMTASSSHATSQSLQQEDEDQTLDCLLTAQQAFHATLNGLLPPSAPSLFDSRATGAFESAELKEERLLAEDSERLESASSTGSLEGSPLELSKQIVELLRCLHRLILLVSGGGYDEERIQMSQSRRASVAPTAFRQADTPAELSRASSLDGTPEAHAALSHALASQVEALRLQSPSPSKPRFPPLQPVLTDDNGTPRRPASISSLPKAMSPSTPMHADSYSSAREVIDAESDLLWGRVNDLLEQVTQICAEHVSTGRHRQARAQDEGSRYDRATLAQPTQGDLPSYEDAENLPDYETGDARQPSTPERDVKQSSRSDEKHAHQFADVASAIERLYTVAPQLANQRTSLRAIPTDRQEIRQRQLVRLGRAIERLSDTRLEGQRAESQPQTPATIGKASVRLADSLDDILSRINKASSRTMGQRAELTPRQCEVLQQAKRTAEIVASGLTPINERQEHDRMERIIKKTGQGRLSRQDASFMSSTPFADQGRRGSTLAEFLIQDGQAISPHGSRPPSQLSADRMSTERKEATSDHIQIYAEAANASKTLSVYLWSNEPLSLACRELRSNMLALAATRHQVYSVKLPGALETYEPLALNDNAGLITIKYRLQPEDTSSSQRSFEIWPASQLNDVRPTALHCKQCHTVLAALRDSPAYLALPSEGWNDLVDTWLCHKTRTVENRVEADSIQAFSGLDGTTRFTPTKTSLLVSSAYLLIDGNATESWHALSNQSQIAQDGSRWYPVGCSTCESPVAEARAQAMSDRLIPAPQRKADACLKFWKHAVTFDATATVQLGTYSSPTFIVNQLLQLSRDTGSYRFRLTCNGHTKVLLWLFNPDMSVMTSQAVIDAGFAKLHKSVKIFFETAERVQASVAKSFEGYQTESLELADATCSLMVAELEEKHRSLPGHILPVVFAGLRASYLHRT
ncbi:uncharacterized protein L969DRAFT_93943 [Mixia osmundae IAM 14324]|uniref:Uncharacterized protein n=1 Tax=Mixia osmundae (strain CBS 9802 / IAM 14324 / JCM 22182 / KY 12970) TaxID=764103 RepID=G7E8L5_MIXOS|nr:uncharacterized protein L969DRAFT_93943 [Mixia osmundae IAM 14324]KEI40117.1 hypothetical protein L969DRAFT_93943 [Mixia osmundae IAM 14324]GAA99483.1 hypothetical protein E5Q_06183 [Mixia osmundae IAM 14324]